MDLGFEEPSAVFESASQNARIWTEQWVHAQLFCPSCGAQRLDRYPNNRAAADFYCARCREDWELKAQQPRFGRRMRNDSFGAMCELLSRSQAGSRSIRPAPGRNPVSVSGRTDVRARLALLQSRRFIKKLWTTSS